MLPSEQLEKKGFEKDKQESELKKVRETPRELIKMCRYTNPIITKVEKLSHEEIEQLQKNKRHKTFTERVKDFDQNDYEYKEWQTGDD